MKHLIVRSRNKSCAPLREIEVPYSVIYRMGSTTATKDILKHRNNKNPLLEINSIKSCVLSGNKIYMKYRFTRAKISTAEWFMDTMEDIENKRVQHYLNIWKTLIVKHRYSSKGNGIYLIKSIEDYRQFLNNKEHKLCEYIIERYYNYSREYRIHVTKNGYFYASRKMLKNEAAVRWHRHADNSVWINEDNKLFNRPDNWNKIVEDCINALKSLGLDIAAFDVKVQSKDNICPKYIILESNSAPSLGEIGINKYKEQLIKLINEERK